MSCGTLTSSSGLSRDHLSISCPAMSTIRGRYSRIACWLNGAIRMLCARRHSGSAVSLVNRPWLVVAVLPVLQPGAELLAEPAVVADLLDQVGAGHDDPGAAAGIVSLKIGPYSRATR